MSEQGILATSPTSAASLTAASTIYIPMVGGGVSNTNFTTEADMRLPLTGATLLDKFYTRINTNARDGSSTMTVRKNGSSTSVAVSVGAGLTGVFSDTSNTASLADGDEVCVQLVVGGTNAGAFQVRSVAARLTCASQAFSYAGWGRNPLSNAVNGTRYFSLGSDAFNSTEAPAQAVAPVALVYDMLLARVSTNAKANACTLKSRVNGADGNQSVTVGAGLTGLFQDTTHSDTLAAGDRFNASWVSTDTGAITVSMVAARLRGGSTTRVPSVSVESRAFPTTTSYYPVYGDGNANVATALQAQSIIPLPGTFSNSAVNVSANASTTDATVQMEVGGSLQAVTMSITAGATGTFTDATHSAHVNAGDLASWKVSGVTTGNITAQSITALFVPDSAGSTVQGVGTSAGASTVNGIGKLIKRAVGAIVGTSTVNGIGKLIKRAAGSSAGVAVATGVSKSIRKAAGSSVGIAVATGVSKARKKAAGAAAGVAIVLGVGRNGAVVAAVTPNERILAIVLETRTLTLAAEVRVLTVATDTSTHTA